MRFPAAKSANTIRGALGLALRAGSAAAYERLFAPPRGMRGQPSGYADLPRPFVFRTAHLDNATFRPGEMFFFDIHLFDLRPGASGELEGAVREMAAAGIGPTRGRARWISTERLELGGGAVPGDALAGAPLVVSLEPEAPPLGRVHARFVTATELKVAGGLAARPEFSILFARLRDRLSTLRALYGAGPIGIDFRTLGCRAEQVRLTDCRLEWANIERRSGRTGQVHPLGGFTGEAWYEGELREFLPWLRASRWTGGGRQTVRGKGEVRVVSPAEAE